MLLNFLFLQALLLMMQASVSLSKSANLEYNDISMKPCIFVCSYVCTKILAMY